MSSVDCQCLESQTLKDFKERDMRFPTMRYMQQAEPQISLCLRAVWSMPLLIA